MERTKEIRRHGTAAGRSRRTAFPGGGANDRQAPIQFLAGDDGRHILLGVEPGGAGDGSGGNEKRTAGQTKNHAAVIARRVPGALHVIAWNSGEREMRR